MSPKSHPYLYFINSCFLFLVFGMYMYDPIECQTIDYILWGNAMLQFGTVLLNIVTFVNSWNISQSIRYHAAVLVSLFFFKKIYAELTKGDMI